MADETKQRPPLKAFVHHQAQAVKETGKALAALLPKGFRDHAGNALGESKQGFQELANGVIDGVEYGLDKLRPKSKDMRGKDKIKVDVE